MNAPLRIGICDDEASNREEWKRQLESVGSFDIRLIYAEQAGATASDSFDSALAVLGERRRAARAGLPASSSDDTLFDDLDILIVDYDLLKSLQGPFITGEEVAYLVRCYSRCKAVVAVNQFGNNPFHLDLGADPEIFPSFADINLGAVQVGNPGLWKTDQWAGFRPWHWPLLPRLVADISQRIADIELDPNKSVFDVLQFDYEALQLVPKSAAQWIVTHTKRPLAELTFSDVVLRSHLGLRTKDQPWSNEAICRIAATRVGKWLDSIILGAQDILVDAPHLVSRYPSLTGESKLNSRVLDRAAYIPASGGQGLDDYNLSEDLKNAVCDAAFQADHWLSRPAWYWHRLNRDQRIPEVRDPWSHDISSLVFCEDISRFVEIDSTRDYRMRLDTQFSIRYCIDPSKTSEELASTVAGIDYQPESRLME